VAYRCQGRQQRYVPCFATCVHVIFFHGTNNVRLGADMPAEEIERRSVGSRLVLASRVFYAATYVFLSMVKPEQSYRC
jgi:hypothetical protein